MKYGSAFDAACRQVIAGRPFRVSVFLEERGDRRTTSTSAAAWLAGFFAVLAIVGGSILAEVVEEMTAPEWRANHEFVETRCVVLEKYIAERPDSPPRYRPEFKIRYTAGGEEYTTATYDAAGVYFSERATCEQVLEGFEIGQEYPCWYDPQSPSSAVLRRGYSWIAWVVPLLPAAFVAVGMAACSTSF
jgi:hypothetical protein